MLSEMGRGAQKTQKTSLGEVTMEQRSKRWEGGLHAGIWKQAAHVEGTDSTLALV